MARYADLLLASAFIQGFYGQKREPIFGNFWCPVVILVTFSSNLSNFEMNFKKIKKTKINKFKKKPEIKKIKK